MVKRPMWKNVAKRVAPEAGALPFIVAGASVGNGVVLRLLVVDVDVRADARDDEQGTQELHKVIVHQASEIADDQEQCADDGEDDTGIEFHAVT